jgi:hypothetical protein
MVKYAVGELRWMEPVIVNVKCYLQPVLYIYISKYKYIYYIFFRAKQEKKETASEKTGLQHDLSGKRKRRQARETDKMVSNVNHFCGFVNYRL